MAVHFPTSEASLFVQSVLQGPLSVGWADSPDSVTGREENRTTQENKQNKTLCPWEQLEGELFPTNLTIVYLMI